MARGKNGVVGLLTQMQSGNATTVVPVASQAQPTAEQEVNTAGSADTPKVEYWSELAFEFESSSDSWEENYDTFYGRTSMLLEGKSANEMAGYPNSCRSKIS